MRTLSKAVAVAVLLGGLVSSPVTAQASIDIEEFRAMLIDGFEKARTMDLEFAMAIPDSAFRWAPTEGVRTFSEQVAHGGISNTLFVAGPVLSEDRPVVGDTAVYLNDRDALVEALNRAYDYVIEGVIELPADEFLVETTLFGQTMPKWRVLLQALTHGIWTRGQMVPYFRLNGAKPPNYRAF
jgi:uncharacterized damage-inducible protein DinB